MSIKKTRNIISILLIFTLSLATFVSADLNMKTSDELLSTIANNYSEFNVWKQCKASNPQVIYDELGNEKYYL